MRERCRVYWGSHGCDLPGGHGGRHRCACADDPCDCDDEGCCEDCPRDGRCIHNVGAYPYYGWGTGFYGEDAPRFQLRHTLWQVLHPYHSWPHRPWMVYAFWDRPTQQRRQSED